MVVNEYRSHPPPASSSTLSHLSSFNFIHHPLSIHLLLLLQLIQLIYGAIENIVTRNCCDVKMEILILSIFQYFSNNRYTSIQYIHPYQSFSISPFLLHLDFQLRQNEIPPKSMRSPKVETV